MAQRQNYSYALGIRAGESGQTSGVTFKRFVSDNWAIEGVCGYWHSSLSLTAVVERHQSFFRVRGLNWYLGAGMHAAGQTGYSYWYDFSYRAKVYRDGGASYGIDAVLGLEYKIQVAPIAFGIDFKPYMELNLDSQSRSGMDPGVFVRLAF